MKILKSAILLSLPIVFTWCLSSCAREEYAEKRSGPWKVTKVEQAFYATSDTTEADSIVVYESDTLGSFNFYNTHPYGNVYILINYPSCFLGRDFDAEYEVHPNNREILTFFAGYTNDSYINFSVKGENNKKQVWTTIGEYKDGLVRESIWVKKISNIY